MYNTGGGDDGTGELRERTRRSRPRAEPRMRERRERSDRGLGQDQELAGAVVRPELRRQEKRVNFFCFKILKNFNHFVFIKAV